MRRWTTLVFLTLWLGGILAFPIQDTSGSYQKYHAPLERRTDPPWGSTLYDNQIRRAGDETAAAFKKDPALRTRVLRALGIEKFGNPAVPFSDLNKVLREAGYEGTYFPEDPKQESQPSTDDDTPPQEYKKLNQAEFDKQRRRAGEDTSAAFKSDPALKARVFRALGIERYSNPNISIPELNKALRQAGYKGTLFPEEHQLQSQPLTNEEYNGQLTRAYPEIKITLRDADFLRRFRKALGLKPNGPVPRNPYEERKWNKALREAGYTGPLLPESDPPKKVFLAFEGPGSVPGESGARSSGTSGRSQFLSTAMQSLSEKLNTPKPQSPGSPFQPAKPFPLITRPLGVFKPLK